MSLGSSPNSPIPQTQASKRALPNITASDISIPALAKKEIADRQADVAKRQKANPMAPDDNGLNSSGLPSSQVYYERKEQPVHTSAIIPITNSRIWIRIISIGALLLSFFWIKEAVDGLRFQSGAAYGALNLIQLVLSFFFFILPAYKLWQLVNEINLLEHDRDESAIASVLYAHGQLWKYAGIAVLGGVAFCAANSIFPKIAGIFRL